MVLKATAPLLLCLTMGSHGALVGLAPQQGTSGLGEGLEAVPTFAAPLNFDYPFPNLVFLPGSEAFRVNGTTLSWVSETFGQQDPSSATSWLADLSEGNEPLSTGEWGERPGGGGPQTGDDNNTGGGTTSGFDPASTVPEPSSLLFTAIAFACSRRRRR